MGRLEGQAALVTGAGTGIGRASAVALAAEGAALALAGRRPAPLDRTAEAIRAGGGRALVLPADVADPAAARRLVAQTEARLGRLDVLVNNAGVNVGRRSVGSLDPADLDAVLRVNLTAPLVLTQAALPGMLARGSGTIITVGSMAAVNASPMAGAAYSASKAAVANLMQNVNHEYRARGVRACTIHPGEVDTPILEGRALVPDAAARATMMRAEDVADVICLCACLPPRTAIEDVQMRPTFLRDIRADLESALKA